jgi:hypothetical protein
MEMNHIDVPAMTLVIPILVIEVRYLKTREFLARAKWVRDLEGVLIIALFGVLVLRYFAHWHWGDIYWPTR